MGCRIDLDIRGDKHIVPYLDDVVVNEGAVHVDDHTLAYEDMPAVLAVKVNVDSDITSAPSDNLAENLMAALRVAVVCAVEFMKQTLGPEAHGRKLRIASVENLSVEAFLQF